MKTVTHGEGEDSTALLVMDLQTGVLDRYPAELSHEVLGSTQRAIKAARARGNPVIYVRLAFRNGAPEVHPRNRLFAQIATLDIFNEHDPGSLFHPDIEPSDDDLTVYKKRASAFRGSDLGLVLDSKGISHVVLTGVATSGVVLSTLCEAADADYEVTVLRDACADRDDEVHRVLCEKVFPLRARVIDVPAWELSSAS